MKKSKFTEPPIVFALKQAETGGRELEEIADGCELFSEETRRVLELLVREGRVVKRSRGGTLNRGRKMKFHSVLF